MAASGARNEHTVSDEVLLGRGDRQLVPAVADIDVPESREGVDVPVAVGVPEAGALAPHERDGVARVGSDRVVALERLELLQRHGQLAPIFVPCPASVNSSSRSECGTRPSTM